MKAVYGSEEQSDYLKFITSNMDGLKYRTDMNYRSFEWTYDVRVFGEYFCCSNYFPQDREDSKEIAGIEDHKRVNMVGGKVTSFERGMKVDYITFDCAVMYCK